MKTCPRCPAEADGPGELEAVFGLRRLRGKLVPQSWCRTCRAGGLPVGAQPFRTVLADPPWQYLCGATKLLEVDHVKPVAQYPSLELDLANVRTLCRSCHARHGWRPRGQALTIHLQPGQTRLEAA